MQFHEWGEECFIDSLKERFATATDIVGIGDDCAVIPDEKGEAWLVTTDALIEGVHFLLEEIAARELGYKSVAVNVSDIAAMGGRPRYVLLSIALPKRTETLWVQELIEGVKEACDRWNLSLIGGDTVGSRRDLFLSLTLIGSAPQEQVKYRHRALVGDVIAVSGFLGDSGAGLRALQEKRDRMSVASLISAHFHPEPSPDEASWLAERAAVHAMMDISDGLICDLKRLLKSSRKGALIETSHIPLSASLVHACASYGWDPLQLALTGGEDYCLLFTAAKEDFEELQRNFQKSFHHPLFAIGSITKGEALLFTKGGHPLSIDYPLFTHFQERVDD